MAKTYNVNVHIDDSTASVKSTADGKIAAKQATKSASPSLASSFYNNTVGKTGLAKLASANKTETLQSFAGGAGAAMAISSVKSIVSTVASTQLSLIGSKYGDQVRQNTISNILSATNRVSSIGSAVISGAVLGSVAGPVGAAIGAGIAAATSIGVQAYQASENGSAWVRTNTAYTIDSTRSSERNGVVAELANR